MYSGVYLIAGKTVKITSIYNDVHAMCEDYKTYGDYDFAVEIGEGDIIFEREHADGVYADGYLETLAVYRKIGELIADLNRIIFHGSAISVDNQCYIFTAKSGTGKSTHTRLWREKFGDRAVMVNDDKPILEIKGDEIIVHGTPYNGKHRLSTNTSVPLKAICIINRGDENTIQNADKNDAFVKLITQTYRTNNPKTAAKVIALLDKIVKTVPIYQLYCNMEKSAVDVAYNAMKGDLNET